MRSEYDYIIVGAGSSGCVLANRLSADPSVSVLVVESGPDDKSPLIHMPRGIGKLLVPGNAHVWDYKVSPRGNAPEETWLKGRAVGGSSSINGMVYVRGAPLDYDTWAELGCTGWGWDEMGRRFIELEDHELGADTWRGTGGPLHVSMHPTGDALCEAVLGAAQEMGVKRVADMNHVESVLEGGMGYQPTTTWHGKRFSAAKAFLTPVRGRPNLDVLPNTNVLGIDFQDRRASGLRIRNEDGDRSLFVRREIILSAGAIHSPKLLQLSGIGPGALLQSHGIPVLVDAPDVGRNLRDHRYLSTQYRVTGNSLNSAFAGLGLLKSVANYALRSKGPLTHSAHEVGGFVRTRPELEHTDAQIGMGLYSIGLDENGAPAVEKQPGMTILGYFTRPESQGEVRIRSNDPLAPPIIEANHFSAEIDRTSAVSLFHWLRRLAKQPALAPWIVEETVPGPRIQTDDDVLREAVNMGGTTYHVCGTCRMGIDDDAVLDTELRVRGVEGLRVIDTSMMPTIVSGNTNAPAMALALRAADFILQAA